MAVMSLIHRVFTFHFALVSYSKPYVIIGFRTFLNQELYFLQNRTVHHYDINCRTQEYTTLHLLIRKSTIIKKELGDVFI